MAISDAKYYDLSGLYEVQDKFLESCKNKKIIEALTEIDAKLEKLQKMCDMDDLNNIHQYMAFGMSRDLILEKINALKEYTDGQTSN